MKIQSKKTKLIQTVTAKQWERLQELNLAKNFDILDAKDVLPSNEVPEEVKGADFKTILKEAKDALKEEKLAEAKDLLLKAQKLKSTPYITNKLKELEDSELL